MAGAIVATAAAAVPLRPWSRGRSNGLGAGLTGPWQSRPLWSCPGRGILSGRLVFQPYCTEKEAKVSLQSSVCQTSCIDRHLTCGSRVPRIHVAQKSVCDYT